MIQVVNFDTMGTVHMGRILKQVIQSQGRTQKWVAKQLGLTTSNINRICQKTETIQPERLEEFGKVLGVDLIKIVDDAIREADGGSQEINLNILEGKKINAPTQDMQLFLERLETLLEAFNNLSAEERKTFLEKTGAND